MKCPYCNNEAVWCENKEIYGKNYGKSYMVYLCKLCDAYVGCHQNTKSPLGTMANRPLRKNRIMAHSEIDPLWKSGKRKRNEVYQKLSKHFGHEIHVGESDFKKCNQIIEAVRILFPDE